MSKKPFRPFWKGRPKQPAAAPRTAQTIQAEYDIACQEAGDLQYKVDAMGTRLKELNHLRLKLNRELNAMREDEILERIKRRDAAKEAAKEAEGLPTAPPLEQPEAK